MADIDFISQPASAESANQGANDVIGTGSAFGTESSLGEDVANMFGFGSLVGDRHRQHNEAYFDWLRSEASASTARNWDKMMADTQMQRKKADYEAAGFSPLAALEGAGSYAGGTTAVGRSSAAGRGKGSTAAQGIIAGVFGVIGKMLAASTMAQSATAVAQAKADAWKEIAQMRANSSMAVAKSYQDAALDRQAMAAVERRLADQKKQDYMTEVLHYDSKGRYIGGSKKLHFDRTRE